MPEVTRRQFAAYAVAVVLVVLLGGRALRADTSPPAPAPLGAGAGPELGGAGGEGADGTAAAGLEVTQAPAQEGATGAGGPVVVHVAGAVRQPGVYRLTAGARVADALDEAGGARDRADLDALNLAAQVTDGEQVLVLKRGAPATGGGGVPPAGAGAAGGGATAPAGAAAAAPGAPVNINSASAVELEALQGVGPATAAKIIAFREQSGPFRSPDDLLQVSGIGPKTLEGMRAQVQV